MTRIYMANALPQDVARIGLALGLGGTVLTGLGFGDWGIEPTTILEANWSTLEANNFMRAFFVEYPKEEAVWFTRDGVGGNIVRTDFVFHLSITP